MSPYLHCVQTIHCLPKQELGRLLHSVGTRNGGEDIRFKPSCCQTAFSSTLSPTFAASPIFHQQSPHPTHPHQSTSTTRTMSPSTPPHQLPRRRCSQTERAHKFFSTMLLAASKFATAVCPRLFPQYKRIHACMLDTGLEDNTLDWG